MTPGLAGPPFPAKATKGAIVGVASLDSPSVPVAVGICSIDVSKLQTTQGVKGCAVETFHWAGDELWDWSTSGKSGTSAPDSLDGWLEEDVDGLEEDIRNLDLTVEDEDVGGVSLNAKEPQHNPSRNHHIDGEDPLVEAVDLDAGGGMTTKGAGVSSSNAG